MKIWRGKRPRQHEAQNRVNIILGAYNLGVKAKQEDLDAIDEKTKGLDAMSTDFRSSSDEDADAYRGAKEIVEYLMEAESESPSDNVRANLFLDEKHFGAKSKQIATFEGRKYIKLMAPFQSSRTGDTVYLWWSSWELVK